MKYLILTILICSFSFAGFSRDHKLRAYLDNKQFYAPGVGNYVEFQLQFVGHSINYTGKDNGLIGDIAIKMIVMKGDDIIQSDAYRLATPFMKDSIVEDFYDIKRFVLKPGEYDFHIELQDLNSEHEALTASQTIVVEDLSNAISISDIEVAEYASAGTEDSPFYRSGYNIIPRLSTFYPEELSTIPAYLEVYNSDKLEDSIFGIKQSIVNAETGEELEAFTRFSTHKTSPVIPVLKPINIETLTTGTYLLTYTIMNRNMIELSSQAYEFERSNDINIADFSDEVILDPNFQESITEDSIGYYLESLIPISRPKEVKNIIRIAKKKDAEAARRHIQVFWAVTKPDNPYEGWIKYKHQVQLVERLFANNFQEGFETDRGRVYLQYGSPTNIVERLNSPSEYPYEIWTFNKIGRFSNKRFVFYNPDLVNNTYRLLHSDMVGELKNPAWPRELAKRNSDNGNVDDPNRGNRDHWGGNSEELFRGW